MYQNFVTPNLPYQVPFQPNYSTKSEIIKVNGENGARTFVMTPNSSALLLDEKEPIVWLVQTDGAGYKTVNAYKIEPVPTRVENITDFEKRLSRLEEIIDGKSNITNTVKKSTENINEQYYAKSEI